MDPLVICREVMEIFREEFMKEYPYLIPIPNCPIEALKPEVPKKILRNTAYMRENHFLGFTHMEFTDWDTKYSHSRKSSTINTHLIEVAIEDRITKHPLPIHVILPTFIHELAHAITPSTQFLRNNKWEFSDSHGEDFYENFGILLRIAEKNGIFKLPSKPKKFSMANLKRYDALDIVTIAPGLVGTSEKYGTSLEGIDRTIRLLLIDPQNVKKLIMVHIEKSSIQSILKMARQKYRKKYNYITIPSG